MDPETDGPVAGKPVIGCIFDLLARQSVYGIHVNVRYLADAIFDSYGEDVRVGGAEVHFREEELMGTAGGSSGSPIVFMGGALTDVNSGKSSLFTGRKGRRLPSRSSRIPPGTAWPSWTPRARS